MTYPNYLVVSVIPCGVEAFLNAVSDLFRRNKQEHWTASDGFSIIGIWAHAEPEPKVCVALSCNFDYLNEDAVRAINGVEA